MKLNKELRTIYITTIVCSIIFILAWGGKEMVDSPSYIHAADKLLSGKIDSLRTPAYPLIIGVCKILFGEAIYKFAIIIVQYIIFLASIYFYYHLVIEIIKKPRLSFWITMTYAVYPAILSWNNCIMTESLAISGSVFLLFFTLRLFKRFSVRAAFLFFFWLAFLLFLRPSFLYLLPIYFVFWLACICTKRSRNAFFGIIITTFVIISELLYVSQFKTNYGVFSPSTVSIINQYYIARQYGIIYVDGIKNESLKEEITRSINQNGISTDNHTILWNETTELLNKYPYEDVQQVVSVSMRKNPVNVLKGAFGRAYKAASRSISYTPLRGFSTIFDMFGANISFLYLFIITYTIVIVRWVCRKRKLAYFSILLYMIGTSNLITAIFGAQQEWSRLILPSMPIYLLLFGQLCCLFRIGSPLNVDFE